MGTNKAQKQRGPGYYLLPDEFGSEGKHRNDAVELGVKTGRLVGFFDELY